MYQFFLGLVGLLSATAAGAAPLTPAMIRNDIHRSGAKAVVNRLFRSGDYERIVLERIKAGDRQWVLLASPLSNGTDAATSEELMQALVYALPKAPQAVLSAIDLSHSSVPRSPENVCSASFFEGDRTSIPRYRVAAVRAVEAVTRPGLRRARRECLRYLTKR